MDADALPFLGTTSAPNIIRHSGGRRLRDSLTGFLLGAFVGIGLWLLGCYQPSGTKDMFLAPAAAGALLGLTGLRKYLWAGAFAVLGLLLVIGYSPLVPALTKVKSQSDPLTSAPAVIVLSSSVHRDGALSSRAQDRALEGFSVLRGGYAPLLVLTDSVQEDGSQVPALRGQMRTLGLRFPVEVTGPVRDTHDEALAVALIARRRGWKRVILVTHSWHMRRAAAVFRRAGVGVLRRPCPEGDYDLGSLDAAPARYQAFRDWLHEAVGYQVYRWRGWV